MMTREEFVQIGISINTKAGMVASPEAITYLTERYDNGIACHEHWLYRYYAPIVFCRTDAYKNRIEQYRNEYSAKYKEIREANPHASVFSFDAVYGGKSKKFLINLCDEAGFTCNCDFCKDENEE